jgi:hypothetical protein
MTTAKQQEQQPQVDLSQPVTIALNATMLGGFQAKVPTIVRLAQEFEIVDGDSYEASETLISVGTMSVVEVIEFFKASKAAAFATHRAICEMENKLTQPYKDAEKILAAKRLTWRTKVERDRQAIEAAKSAALQKQNEAQAIEDAAELQRMGAHEEAELVIEKAATAPAPQAIVAPAPMHSTGGRIGGKWEVRIDKPDDVQREYCSPDLAIIQPVVNGLGRKHPIKGISIEWKEKEAFSRKQK